MGDELSALQRKFNQLPARGDRGALAGRNDPGTSALAAQKMRQRGRLAESEKMIMGVLVHNAQGLTAGQIAERLTFKICRGEARPFDWWRFEVSRRMRGLVRQGQAMESALRTRCPVIGSISIVWMPDPRRNRPHWQEGARCFD